MTQIKPTGNRALVRLDTPESVRENGLVIPDIAQEKAATGVVEAVGVGTIHPRLREFITVAEQGVEVGDRVLLTSAYAGSESGEEGLILVDLSEVLAVLP